MEGLKALGLETIFVLLVLLLVTYGLTKLPPWIHASHYVHIAKRSSANGLIFGRCLVPFSNYVIYSPAAEEGHAICIAESGAGKTTRFLIPTINAWQYGGYHIDISGDICKNCYTKNKLVYEPSNPQTTPYNIFATIDMQPDQTQKNIALEQIALQLIPPLPASAGAGAKYFNDGARAILTSALLAFYPKGLDFVEICNMIYFSGSLSELGQAIEETKNPLAIAQLDLIKPDEWDVIDRDARSCKNDAAKAISFLVKDPNVSSSLRRPKANEICISPTSMEDHAVFFSITEINLKYLLPLMRIISVQMLDYAISRPIDSKTPILITLDEYSSLGFQITEYLQRARKHHVRIITCIQTVTDLDLVLTQGAIERKSQLNNYRYKIIMGSTEPDSQEYLSQLLGNAHSNPFRAPVSETPQRLVRPDQLANMGDCLYLTTPGGTLKLLKNYPPPRAIHIDTSKYPHAGL